MWISVYQLFIKGVHLFKIGKVFYPKHRLLRFQFFLEFSVSMLIIMLHINDSNTTERQNDSTMITCPVIQLSFGTISYTFWKFHPCVGTILNEICTTFWYVLSNRARISGVLLIWEPILLYWIMHYLISFYNLFHAIKKEYKTLVKSLL